MTSDSRPASKAEGDERDEVDEAGIGERSESKEEDRPGSETRVTPSTRDATAPAEEEEDSSVPPEIGQTAEDPVADGERIKELVTTEFGLEQQLENVQRQLLALKQLPSEIESHLRIVSEQLRKIMELSGVRSLGQNGSGRQRRDSSSGDRDSPRFRIEIAAQ